MGKRVGNELPHTGHLDRVPGEDWEKDRKFEVSFKFTPFNEVSLAMLSRSGIFW